VGMDMSIVSVIVFIRLGVLMGISMTKHITPFLILPFDR